MTGIQCQVILRSSTRFSIVQVEYSPCKFSQVKITSDFQFNRRFIESFLANALNVFQSKPRLTDKRESVARFHLTVN